MRQYALEPFLRLTDELLAAQSLIERRRCLAKRLRYGTLIAWLRQIMLHAAAHGGPRIVEVAESGQHDEEHIRIRLGHLLDELQAVHPRHAYIGNDDIRTLLLDECLRLQAVACRADQPCPAAFPVDDGRYA